MRHGMVQQLSKRPTNAEHVLALKLLTKVQHAAGDDDQSTACVAYTQEQKLGIAQKQHESSTRTDAVCQGRNHVQQGHGGKIVGEVTQTVAQHQAEQPGCDLVQLVVNLGTAASVEQGQRRRVGSPTFEASSTSAMKKVIKAAIHEM